MAYATVEQLEAYPVVVPSGVDAELLLTRASRDVDRALLTAVYPVDDDGLPTEAAHVVALRNATIEQAAGMIAAGAYPGAQQPSGGFTIGKISMQRGVDTVERVARGQLYSQAWQILQAAGLTGGGPQTW